MSTCHWTHVHLVFHVRRDEGGGDGAGQRLWELRGRPLLELRGRPLLKLPGDSLVHSPLMSHNILSFEPFRTGILHLQGLDLTPSLHFPLCSAWVLQDELLGLADDPNADSVFRSAALDMDVLYRTGETHHVEALTRCFCPKTPSFSL
jgi:hypothetical protein